MTVDFFWIPTRFDQIQKCTLNYQDYGDNDVGDNYEILITVSVHYHLIFGYTDTGDKWMLGT